MRQQGRLHRQPGVAPHQVERLFARAIDLFPGILHQHDADGIPSLFGQGIRAVTAIVTRRLLLDQAGIEQTPQAVGKDGARNAQLRRKVGKAALAREHLAQDQLHPPVTDDAGGARRRTAADHFAKRRLDRRGIGLGQGMVHGVAPPARQRTISRSR